MTLRVEVQPHMLQWAMKRAHKSLDDLDRPDAPVSKWLAGEASPTYKQLETFAHRTYTAVGALLLPQPPQEELPVADYRTKSGLGEPSADLLDTLYMMQERQDWYILHVIEDAGHALPFVGRAKVTDDADEVALDIQNTLHLALEHRSEARTWEDALREMIAQVRENGILVMLNGVVGSNTHRVLDPDEFRGFTLIDKRAPLIFLNNADSKSAQMFTLAHELAHIWLGEGGLDDVEPTANGSEVETWCNRVAAAVLVPSYDLGQQLQPTPLATQLEHLVRRYKVSRAVVLRSLEHHAVDHQDRVRLLRAEYVKEKPGSSGGDFHTTTRARLGDDFAASVIANTLEGRTSYREAFELLGVAKPAAFEELARKVGVIS